MEKVSNLHYQTHMKCLKAVDSSFSGDHLVVPEDLVAKLTQYIPESLPQHVFAL